MTRNDTTLTDAARHLFGNLFDGELDIDERPTTRKGETWLSYADGQWRGWLPVAELNACGERAEEIANCENPWQRAHDLLHGEEDWLAGLDADDAARRIDLPADADKARAWLAEARDLDDLDERLDALLGQVDADDVAELLAQAPPLPTYGGDDIDALGWHALVSWDAERVLEVIDGETRLTQRDPDLPPHAEIAKACGVSLSAVRQWMCGQTACAAHHVDTMARAFGLDRAALVGRLAERYRAKHPTS